MSDKCNKADVKHLDLFKAFNLLQQDMLIKKPEHYKPDVTHIKWLSN